MSARYRHACAVVGAGCLCTVGGCANISDCISVEHGLCFKLQILEIPASLSFAPKGRDLVAFCNRLGRTGPLQTPCPTPYYGDDLGFREIMTLRLSAQAVLQCQSLLFCDLVAPETYTSKPYYSVQKVSGIQAFLNIKSALCLMRQEVF
jgi:hypothetical protein